MNKVVYLICYDIHSTNNWRRCHTLCSDYGCPIQKSIFAATLTHKQARELFNKLELMIDEDDKLFIASLNGEQEVFCQTKEHIHGIYEIEEHPLLAKLQGSRPALPYQLKPIY